MVDLVPSPAPLIELCEAQGRMLTPRKLFAAKDTNLLRFNSSEKREEFMFMIIRFWNLLYERELTGIYQRPSDCKIFAVTIKVSHAIFFRFVSLRLSFSLWINVREFFDH